MTFYEVTGSPNAFSKNSAAHFTWTEMRSIAPRASEFLMRRISTQTSEDMMRDADTAMYQAKRAGKARHEVFNERMHNAAKEMLRLETDLRKAVERDELMIFYQPIFDLDANRIVGFESLARWSHAEMGMVSPSKFIPIAEEIGVIDILCEQILRRACRDIGSLRDLLPVGETPTLSVNLASKQFAQTSLVRNIERILEETQYPPHLLNFEVTESVFVEHHARAIEMLRAVPSLRNRDPH